MTAALDPRNDTITVRVVDDGPGIAPDSAERVFGPHQRGPTDGPGAGLGLAIARGIVEAHGGVIGFEPVASGTVVAVTLPVEPTSAGTGASGDDGVLATATSVVSVDDRATAAAESVESGVVGASATSVVSGVDRAAAAESVESGAEAPAPPLPPRPRVASLAEGRSGE